MEQPLGSGTPVERPEGTAVNTSSSRQESVWDRSCPLRWSVARLNVYLPVF